MRRAKFLPDKRQGHADIDDPLRDAPEKSDLYGNHQGKEASDHGRRQESAGLCGQQRDCDKAQFDAEGEADVMKYRKGKPLRRYFGVSERYNSDWQK